MKSNIQATLDSLKTTDIYSLILFALYKMEDVPEYSTLSELVYLLDKDSLFNLLEYYGGLTIKIPTKYELETIVNALLLYQFTVIDKMEMEDALPLLNERINQKDILNAYSKLIGILNDYNFER